MSRKEHTCDRPRMDSDAERQLLRVRTQGHFKFFCQNTHLGHDVTGEATNRDGVVLARLWQARNS